jgi:hypothetical protein
VILGEDWFHHNRVILDYDSCQLLTRDVLGCVTPLYLKRVEKSKKTPQQEGRGCTTKIRISYEKRPIGGEKNRNYIASYSLEFRRTTSGSMPLGSP